MRRTSLDTGMAVFTIAVFRYWRRFQGGIGQQAGKPEARAEFFSDKQAVSPNGTQSSGNRCVLVRKNGNERSLVGGAIRGGQRDCAITFSPKNA